MNVSIWLERNNRSSTIRFDSIGCIKLPTVGQPGQDLLKRFESKGNEKKYINIVRLEFD